MPGSWASAGRRGDGREGRPGRTAGAGTVETFLGWALPWAQGRAGPVAGGVGAEEAWAAALRPAALTVPGHSRRARAAGNMDRCHIVP